MRVKWQREKSGKRQPYSAGGTPFGPDLLAKPDVLSYDRGEGTAKSAAFAASLAALVPLADCVVVLSVD